MSDFQNDLQFLLPEIMASPRLFLHRLDMEKSAALVIDADRNFYKDAVFLDHRALGPGSRGAWVPLDILWRHMDAAAVNTDSETIQRLILNGLIDWDAQTATLCAEGTR